MNNPLEWLRENHGYVLEMLKISHGYQAGHSPYHLEGDVYTHTMLVYNYAKNNYEFSFVLLACLLHDFGKAYTAEIDHEKKRCFFKGHEGVSFFRSIDIVKEFVNILAERDGVAEAHKTQAIRSILFSIANHGFHFNHKLENFDSAYGLFKPFRYSDVSSLSSLMEADYYGRIFTKENDEPLRKIKLIEQVAFNLSKKKFQSDSPLEKEVAIMIGLPGSGKSTYAKENLSTYDYLSRDEIVQSMHPEMRYSDAFNAVDHKEVDKILMKRFNKMLDNSDKCVVDLTNLSKKSRRKWITQAKQKGFSTRAIVMATDFSTCVDRRSEGKFVPYDVINNMSKRFTFPLGDEFDTVDMIL
jgi:putative nucleotidyltransferase with HDIG domain